MVEVISSWVTTGVVLVLVVDNVDAALDARAEPRTPTRDVFTVFVLDSN